MFDIINYVFICGGIAVVWLLLIESGVR